MTSRLSLSVQQGPRAGEVFLARAGESLVVGREPRVAVFIADQGISRRHFELSWDGSICRITDLGSTNGTLVNGQPVRAAVLRDGDRIEAGETTFRIEIREEPLVPSPPPPPPPPRTAAAPMAATPVRAPDPPPVPEPIPEPPLPPEPAVSVRPVPIFRPAEPVPEPAPAPTPERGSLLEQLSESFFPGPDTRLYALIDAAQSKELVFRAQRLGDELYTLFSGSMATEVAHAGPCLALLSAPLQFLVPWLEAMGSNAGILFESSADLSTLCTHLREIFVVTDESGQEFFFRYYDPRVLRTYLPTCTADELRAFFGPVDRWFAEDESGEGVCIYEISAAVLAETTLKP